MRFSIVVPTYGRPAAIRACVESLARLDHPAEAFEVLVVEDGGPTEELRELRERPPAGLDVRFLGQPRSGPAAARNLGARHARYEYLAFTDDDCRPRPDWLTRLARAFGSRPDAALGGHTVNAVERNAYSTASQVLVTHLVRWGMAHGEPFFASNNFALPRVLYERLGGFDTDFPRAGGEDRDLSDRLAADGIELVHVPEAVIDHFHRLDLRSFVDQHHRYGRAAYQYHRKRATSPVGAPAPLRFYVELVLSPFRREDAIPRPVRVFGLLVVSQLVNALGYLSARRALGGG